jgi:hypothetical protein
MPTPAQSEPDGCWPCCDDEQPGISIRPLSQADLAALLAHLAQHDQHDHDQDLDDPLEQTGPAPVVAVRVRASVGRPGASAHAEYRRRRAVEWAAWTRTLPWRAAAVLAGGLGVGLVAAQLVPRLAGLAGLLAAACLAWALRLRSLADHGPGGTASPATPLAAASAPRPVCPTRTARSAPCPTTARTTWSPTATRPGLRPPAGRSWGLDWENGARLSYASITTNFPRCQGFAARRRSRCGTAATLPGGGRR